MFGILINVSRLFYTIKVFVFLLYIQHHVVGRANYSSVIKSNYSIVTKITFVEFTYAKLLSEVFKVRTKGYGSNAG